MVITSKEKEPFFFKIQWWWREESKILFFLWFGCPNRRQTTHVAKSNSAEHEQSKRVPECTIRFKEVNKDRKWDNGITHTFRCLRQTNHWLESFLPMPCSILIYNNCSSESSFFFGWITGTISIFILLTILSSLLPYTEL